MLFGGVCVRWTFVSSKWLRFSRTRQKKYGKKYYYFIFVARFFVCCFLFLYSISLVVFVNNCFGQHNRSKNQTKSTSNTILHTNANHCRSICSYRRMRGCSFRVSLRHSLAQAIQSKQRDNCEGGSFDYDVVVVVCWCCCCCCCCCFFFLWILFFHWIFFHEKNTHTQQHWNVCRTAWQSRWKGNSIKNYFSCLLIWI